MLTSTSPTSNKYAYIQRIITLHKIVLFMKGTPEQPLCGFSAQVVQALNDCSADFHSENVLANEQLRADLKVFADWPTFPQLYINGTLIGGCDIVRQMHQNNQLKAALDEA